MISLMEIISVNRDEGSLFENQVFLQPRYTIKKLKRSLIYEIYRFMEKSSNSRVNSR